MTSGLPTPPTTRSLLWSSELDTQRFAQALAAQSALDHAYIELQGDLGAGKTTLVRHLLRALGVHGRIKSPTYAVVEPYEVAWPSSGPGEVTGPPSGPGARLNVWHFDFYRFSDPREWEDAGFRDIFASPGLKLAEWPQKAASFLPPADLVLRLVARDDEQRDVHLTAQTATGCALLQGITPMLAPAAAPDAEHGVAP